MGFSGFLNSEKFIPALNIPFDKIVFILFVIKMDFLQAKDGEIEIYENF